MAEALVESLDETLLKDGRRDTCRQTGRNGSQSAVNCACRLVKSDFDRLVLARQLLKVEAVLNTQHHNLAEVEAKPLVSGVMLTEMLAKNRVKDI